MKKIIFGFLIALMLVSFVSAAELNVVEELDRIKTIYNENVESVPGFVTTLFGNEQINIYVSEVKQINDVGEAIYSISMKEGVMENIQEGAIEEPTMNAYLSEETLLKLLWSEDPFNDFKAALDEGSVTYQAVTLTGKIKYGLAGLIGTVVSWFT